MKICLPQRSSYRKHEARCGWSGGVRPVIPDITSTMIRWQVKYWYSFGHAIKHLQHDASDYSDWLFELAPNLSAPKSIKQDIHIQGIVYQLCGVFIGRQTVGCNKSEEHCFFCAAFRLEGLDFMSKTFCISLGNEVCSG